MDNQEPRVTEQALPAKGELLTADQRDKIEAALRKAWPAAFKDTHSKAMGQLIWATEQACIASAALTRQAAPEAPTKASTDYSDPTLACSSCGLTMGESRTLGHIKLGILTAAATTASASIDNDEFWNHVIAYCKGVGNEGQALVDYVMSWHRAALARQGAAQAKPVCRNCADFGWEPSISGERRPCGFCKPGAAQAGGTIYVRQATLDNIAKSGFVKHEITVRTEPNEGWVALAAQAAHAGAVSLPKQGDAHRLAIAAKFDVVYDADKGVHHYHGFIENIEGLIERAAIAASTKGEMK